MNIFKPYQVSFLGLLLTFMFYIIFGSQNISGLVLAKAIPHYPNSDSWKIYSSNGIPDGGHSTYIVFHTKDSFESIVDFYRTKFEKLGWTLEDTVVTCSNSMKIHIPNKKFSGLIEKCEGPWSKTSTAEIHL